MLLTIEQYQAKRRSEIALIPTGSGIACPNCGVEMHDKWTPFYHDNPPQKQVVCHECLFSTLVIA